MMRYDIREVLPEVFRIPVPLEGNPLKELNSYLFRGSKGGEAAQSAGGYRFRTEGCKRSLRDWGSLAYPWRIHGYPADIFMQITVGTPQADRPGGRVYISRRCRFMDGTLQEHRSERFRENGIEESLLQAMLACTPSRTMAAPLSFRDYTLLEEGDVILAGRYTLRAIWTPGHTPGHFCFEVCSTSAMLLGDHVLFDITPNITDWWDVPDSLGDYLRSLDKLEAYPVTLPFPGHRQARI